MASRTLPLALLRPVSGFRNNYSESTGTASRVPLAARNFTHVSRSSIRVLLLVFFFLLLSLFHRLFSLSLCILHWWKRGKSFTNAPNLDEDRRPPLRNPFPTSPPSGFGRSNLKTRKLSILGLAKRTWKRNMYCYANESYARLNLFASSLLVMRRN